MNLDSFTGPGSTPSRRRFWDKVTQSVIASQKVAGKNVSVDEHQGYGTIISVNPQRQGGGVCPPDDVTLTVVIAGVTFDCGCTDLVDGSGHSGIVTNVSINGTFMVPSAGFGSWALTPAGQIHEQVYDAEECAGSLILDEDLDMNLFVDCADGVFTVEFSDPLRWTVFFGSGSATVTNAITCGEDHAGSTGAAHGGTATITW